MKKRILGWALIFSLLLALLPAAALAAGETCNGTHSGWTALEANIASLSGRYYLSDNVTAGGSITVSSTATLCLNGKVMDLNEHNITVTSGGSLTICDCNARTEHRFTENSNGLWVLDETGSETVAGGVITGGRAENGGAILVEGGTLTLESGSIAGSNADKGGGVYVSNGGFTMTSGTITGNLANGVGDGTSGTDICGGGGAYVSAGGTFTMSGGSIENNTVAVSAQNDGGGGVLIDYGSFTMSGGTITGNAVLKKTKDGGGGGVYLSRGNFTMTAGAISGNEAASGGGVFVFGRNDTETGFSLSGGSITGNHASDGGGVYLAPSSYKGVFALSGAPDISGNTAGSNRDASNILVNNNVITLETPLAEGKEYGVATLSNTGGFITSGWGTHMSGKNPTDYFTPEMDGALIMLYGNGSSQEVLLHTHYYTYNADDQADTITQSCACGHKAVATLSVPEGPYYANGSSITPAAVTYSGDTWAGQKPELSYENNIAAGTATARLTIGSETVSVTFEILEPLPDYTVTFDANGHGDAPVPQSVQQGGKVTEPNVPTASGYTFGGWYKEAGCVIPWEFGSDTVSGNLTLYAKWTAIAASAPVVITGEDTIQTYGTANGQVSVTVTETAGYTYAYQWYSSDTDGTSGGTSISGEIGSSCTIPAGTPVGRHYYYCQVTATRSDNGQTVTVVSGVITVTITQAAQSAPGSGEGYAFCYENETIAIEEGYEVYTAQTGGDEIASGSAVTPGDTIYIRIPGSVTHAPSDWTEIHIPARPQAPVGITKTDETIRDKRDGTVSGITAEMEYKIDSGSWAPGTGEPLTGLSAGTVVTVRYPASAEKFSSEEATVTIGSGSKTLTVIFEENGGSEVAAQTGLSYGAVVPEPAVPQKNGYTFDGWYRGETKWNFERDTVTTDLTLEARWTAVTYTITYDLNGGSLGNGTSNPAAYTVETEPFSLNNPTKAGYAFAGWTDGDGSVPQETVTIFKGTTGNKTYAAQWTLNAPAATLSASVSSAVYGETITLTAGASHDASGLDYTYTWYKDGSPAPIAEETAATLPLSAVADSGSYHVVVTASDDVQSQMSASAAVSVTIVPRAVALSWDYTAPITFDGSAKRVTAAVTNRVGSDTFALNYEHNEKTDAGTYTAKVTALGNENYTLEGGTGITKEWEIVPAMGSASVTMEDWTYGDTAKAPAPVSATNGTDNVTCRYTGITTGGDTYDGADVPTAAGQYTVTVTFEATDNYKEVTAATQFTIGPRPVALRWSGETNAPYNGSTHTVAAEITNLVPDDTCELTYADNEKTEAGIYTAQVIAVGNPNYTLDGNTNKTLDWQITKIPGSASVTMNGWTYGDEPSTPVPGSATNGMDHVTYHYDGRDGTTYNSDAIPTDAGSYTVTATFAATQNYEQVTAEAAFAIAPKTISAAWLGLDQVYGGDMDVQVKVSGALDGDQVTAQVNEAVPDDAGSYELTAALTGKDGANYILKNDKAILTIQPKPVIFTVADNAVQADGSEKDAAIAADDKNCTYTVTYRRDGKEGVAPQDAGSYEIWVKLTNDNYRHTDGSAEMQVGTLTITQAPPVVYTASFAGGESTQGTAPAPQTAAAGGLITLPASPFAREDHLFTGWTADGDTRLYQPGDCFTMPARNVTFTARWQAAVFTVNGIVTEKTDTTARPVVADAVVSLWLGANKINETTTKADGTYEFEHLIPGTYNLVVTKDVRTVTSKVEITTESETRNITLPQGATNSVVEVAPGSPDIVVGQLDTVFDEIDETVYTTADEITVRQGGEVEITFTAAEKQKSDVASDLEEIQTISGGTRLALTMDYTLTKTVTAPDGSRGTPQSIHQTNVPLEILLPLPTELQGKASYSVYRVHNGQAQQLNQGESNKNELDEYFTVNSDKTSLTLYVKCFSTYAIGYMEWAGSGSQGGSSGGGASAPVYPPQVEQPEHGSVDVKPSSPKKGDKVTITPTPEDGFTVDEVIVTGPNGDPVAVTPNEDGAYTFTQPAEKVTITVTFRQIGDLSDCPRDESCPMTPFADADRFAWYHDGVHYCVDKGLMVGIGRTTFAPDTATTRGMLVTILWRLEGSPVINSPMVYDDVVPGAWYGEAVGWADGAGVVTGYGDGKFGPNDLMTREQMAVMLWRYAGSPDVDGNLSSFADGAETSDWAQPAMIWAVDQGLIAGIGNNRLEPQGQATRAQVATILMRFDGILA